MALPVENIPFELTSAEAHAEEIIFEIVGLTERLTDLNIGGVARSMIEALAIQLEKLDAKMFYGLERGIPTEAYTAFGFSILPATKATGTVTFIREAGSSGDIAIPKGSVVVAPATDLSPQARFLTLQDKLLIDGSNDIDIPVVAQIAGTVNNVSAGRVSKLNTPITNIASVFNSAAIKNGAEAETEEERQVRFRKFVVNLARSPLAGIEVGATGAQIFDIDGTLIERVVKVVAFEPENTVGRVQVYIDSGGGSASGDLVALAQKLVDGYKDQSGALIPGYKAAGIVVFVAAIVSVPVPVTVAVELSDGYNFTDVKEAVQNAVEDFFLALDPGGELIWVDIVSTVASVPGVKDLKFTTPTANLNADRSERLLAGTVVITESKF